MVCGMTRKASAGGGVGGSPHKAHVGGTIRRHVITSILASLKEYFDTLGNTQEWLGGMVI